jgi:hypothetical protein
LSLFVIKPARQHGFLSVNVTISDRNSVFFDVINYAASTYAPKSALSDIFTETADVGLMKSLIFAVTKWGCHWPGSQMAKAKRSEMRAA